MRLAAKCKFCGMDLVLEIDDDYAAVGDPMGLLPKASCNRCADRREKKRLLEDALSDLCGQLTFEKKRDWARPVLERLTQKYAALVADWYNRSGMLWDQEFVEQILEKPEKIGAIINAYWKTFRISQKLL